MKLPAAIAFIYGILLLIGGIMGHIKANSLPSLIMGTTFAVLIIACAIAMIKESVLGYTCAIVLSVLLTAFFTYRFFLSFKFMPAGLMAIVSIAVALTLLWIKKNPVCRIKA